MSSTCTDPAMAGFVAIIKNVMTVFQVIIPILLMVSVALAVGKLVLNPDAFVDQKGKDHAIEIMKNKVLAAVVIFFLPYIITLTINLVGSVMENDNGTTGFSFIDCMRNSNPNIIEWNPGG